MVTVFPGHCGMVKTGGIFIVSSFDAIPINRIFGGLCSSVDDFY